MSRCLARCRDSNLNREETLFKLATEVRGVYVPAFYEGIPGYGGAVFPTREGVPERVVRRVATPDPFMQARGDGDVRVWVCVCGWVWVGCNSGLLSLQANGQSLVVVTTK